MPDMGLPQIFNSSFFPYYIENFHLFTWSKPFISGTSKLPASLFLYFGIYFTLSSKIRDPLTGALPFHKCQSHNCDDYKVTFRGRDMLDKGMVHIQGGMAQDGARSHHVTQNSVQFKADELFHVMEFSI